ncbi:F-box/SEL1-like repeat protein [Candidatus Odyssella thessalonicensis]|uniref:F-box/SEL1-like repeat protein n=1 Tax=Candidatus Odyssella thessalonicensis TaxID=84647 RepID=UPI000225BD87|nr:F-box/SEL1-like repeat protein [Candidatus Odyssella thessalonicensis]
MIKIYKILSIFLWTALISSLSLAMEQQEDRSNASDARNQQVSDVLSSVEEGSVGEQEQIAQQSSQLDTTPNSRQILSILSLPEEILVEILKYASQRESHNHLLQLRKVCSRFNSTLLSQGQFCRDYEGKMRLIANRNTEIFKKITDFIIAHKDRKKDEVHHFSEDDKTSWGTLIGSAYFHLGELYLDDIFNIPNYQHALKCYIKACQYGSKAALARQVLMYQYGLGVQKNEDEAQVLCEKGPFHPRYGAYEALGDGHNGTHEMLGEINKPLIAVEMLQRAVQEGSIEAIYTLGIMYYYGKGIEKNHTMAIQFLERFKNTPPEAFADEVIDESVGDMTDFYMGKATFLLGKIFYEGTAGEKNFKKAVEYLKECYPTKKSGFYLGDIYENGGRGIETDNKEAAYWYAKAAEDGNEEAQRRLNVMVAEGRISKSTLKQISEREMY